MSLCHMEGSSRNQAAWGSTRLLAVVAESQKRLCEANTIAMFPRFHSWISDYVTLQQHVVDMKPLNENAAPLPTT